MEDFDDLREQAIMLRRAGASRPEIKAQLGITSHSTLSDVLRGEPPPDWAKRPNAKDELHQRARALRGQGWTQAAIAAELSVSKSSVSLWVRDISTPELERLKRRRSDQGEARRLEALRAWQDSTQRQRAAARQQAKLAAATEVGDLTEREVLMLGAMAYWCEGEKDKHYRRREHVSFINSDPYLFRFFMRFLDAAAVQPERCRFRVHIHESADVEEATRYWAEVVHAEPAEFRRPVVKQHNPKTKRKNVEEGYRGCLQVTVLQSAELYRRIEGWAFGVMFDHFPEAASTELAVPAAGNGPPRRFTLW